MTSAPAAWRAPAMACPMPLEEPVTRAALVWSENPFIFQLEQVEEVVPGDGLPQPIGQGVEAGRLLFIGAVESDVAVDVTLEGAVRAPDKLFRKRLGQGSKDRGRVGIGRGKAAVLGGDD